MTKKTRVTIENTDGAQAVADDPFLTHGKNGVPHDDPAIPAGPHTECAHCGQGLPTGAIPSVWFHHIGKSRFECEACFYAPDAPAGGDLTVAAQAGPARKPGRPRGSKTRRTNLDHVVYNCDGQHAEGTIIDRSAPPVPGTRARKPRERTPLDFDPTDRAELTIRETDLCLADALRFVASSRQPWDRPAESLARTLMLSAGYRLRKLHGEGVG